MPTTAERLRLRDLMRVVRATRLPPHPYSKQTCCGACRRKYNRAFMQRFRHPNARQIAIKFDIIVG